jgi:hypothetical protein
MKYRTGDAIITVSSLWVRILTAESFSHVGIILVENDKVYVVETHESIDNTRKILLDTWLENYEIVYVGRPIPEIRQHRRKIQDKIYEYLKKPVTEKKYGYLTLPLVWFNQIFTKHKMPHHLNVCSTFVQEMWNSTGWKFGRLMDPGDVAIEGCDLLRRIK